MKTIRVKDDLYEKVKELAAQEGRSINMQMNYFIVQGLRSPTEIIVDMPRAKVAPKAKVLDNLLEDHFEEVNFHMERGCCVSKTKRCPHWAWNGDRQLYVNSLSGRTVEAEI